jgi:peptidoglycan/LPS O-acetylase OafA/YrhL
VFFENLDGLRFVAFLLVYVQHAFGIPGAAGAGVAFFFVLSGFLITYLLLVEGERRGRVDVRAFYIRRALRIWPLYFLVIAFAFLLYPALKALTGVQGGVQNGNPWLYVFFLANFDVLKTVARDGGGAGFINVLWSISIEEQFYLLWPLLLRRPQRGRALGVLLAVIAFSSAFRLAHADDWPTLYFHSLSVISDMAIGGLAAYTWRHSPGFRARVASLPATVIACGYLAGAAFIATRGLWGPFTRLLAGVVFAAIVLEQNFCRRSLFKMSDSAIFSRLGQYTYGLYMLHMVVLFLLEKAFLLFGLAPSDRAHRVLLPLLGLPLSVFAAWASHRLVESPFLRLKARFSRVASGGVTRGLA